VESIQLEIEPQLPRPMQADLFLPPVPAPQKLQTTLARLAALCGPDRAGTLMPANSHRPETVILGRFAPSAPISGTASLLESNAARLVIRALRPAPAPAVSRRDFDDTEAAQKSQARMVSQQSLGLQSTAR
jgi:hypothetical protein